MGGGGGGPRAVEEAQVRQGGGGGARAEAAVVVEGEGTAWVGRGRGYVCDTSSVCDLKTNSFNSNKL